MTTKTIGDMTEQDLLTLVERVVTEKLEHERGRGWQNEIERQFEMLAPEARTCEAHKWLEGMIDPYVRANYQEENDKTLGMFDFGADFASSARDVLRAEK